LDSLAYPYRITEALSVIYSMARSQPAASVDEYVFNFRDELRAAARASLSNLEDMMNEVGYGWLDGYMEGIMDHESR
jgi:hypothetical protein